MSLAVEKRVIIKLCVPFDKKRDKFRFLKSNVKLNEFIPTLTRIFQLISQLIIVAMFGDASKCFTIHFHLSFHTFLRVSSYVLSFKALLLSPELFSRIKNILNSTGWVRLVINWRMRNGNAFSNHDMIDEASQSKKQRACTSKNSLS